MDINSIISNSIHTFLKKTDTYGKKRNTHFYIVFKKVVLTNLENIFNANLLKIKIDYYPSISIYNVKLYYNNYVKDVLHLEIDINNKNSLVDFIHLWCKNYLNIIDSSEIIFQLRKNNEDTIISINTIKYTFTNSMSFYLKEKNMFIDNIITGVNLLESIIDITRY
jgi:hypothetical protein